MSNVLKTLDPEQFLFHVDGVLIDGYDPDSQVKISQDEDGWNEKAGTTGEVARMKNNNAMGMIEVSLLQSSASNDYLYAKYRADRLSGRGTFPVDAVDTLGTTDISAINCYLKKPADYERGSEVKTTTWRIRVPNMEGASTNNIGGNAVNVDS